MSAPTPAVQGGDYSRSGQQDERATGPPSAAPAGVDVSRLLAPPLGVSFNRHIRVRNLPERGAHFVATKDIPAGETLAETPFHATLSILSIPIAAPHWPVGFIDCFEATPEVLSRLLVCREVLQDRASAWHAYIKLLPSTDGEELNTPLFWNDAERAWLYGTNLYGAVKKREEGWREEWQIAMTRMQQFSVDQEQNGAYTFGLYKWAATILSSRSFTHEVLRGWLHPVSGGSEFARSKLAGKWRSQDMTLTFPVLLPGIDFGNHDPEVRARWISGNDKIMLSHEEAVEVDREVCNNYGLKGSEELILGYGFMLENNDADFVMLSTAAQDVTSQVESASEIDAPHQRGTRLYRPSPSDVGHLEAIMQRSLSSNNLLDLAKHLANSRELAQVDQAGRNQTGAPRLHTRLFTLMADAFALGLEDRRDRLIGSEPPSEPKNGRQRLASAYRDSQIQILDSNIELLSDHLQSLSKAKRIIMLSQILKDQANLKSGNVLTSFVTVLCGQTHPKAKTVRAHNKHELVFAYWIGAVRMLWEAGDLAEDDYLGKWMKHMLSVYPSGEMMEDTFEPMVSNILAIMRGQDGYGVFSTFDSLNPNVWQEEKLSWSFKVWRYERVSLRSFDRMVMNGNEWEHEDMLFMEY